MRSVRDMLRSSISLPDESVDLNGSARTTASEIGLFLRTSEPCPSLRMIGPDDCSVHDRQFVGRIRYSSERSPGLWLWTCIVTLPGPPFGEAGSLDEAKGRFKVAWENFKAKHTPQELVKAFAEMNHANRPVRYLRSAR